MEQTLVEAESYDMWVSFYPFKKISWFFLLQGMCKIFYFDGIMYIKIYDMIDYY